MLHGKTALATGSNRARQAKPFKPAWVRRQAWPCRLTGKVAP